MTMVMEVCKAQGGSETGAEPTASAGGSEGRGAKDGAGPLGVDAAANGDVQAQVSAPFHRSAQPVQRAYELVTRLHFVLVCRRALGTCWSRRAHLAARERRDPP